MAKPALRLRQVALIVPGDSKLKAAGEERDYLLALGDGERKVQLIPATMPDVLNAMKSGQYDGWHFTGHGKLDPAKPNLSVLRLEKGQNLQPGMLTMGSVQNLGKAQPLVFLNACQTGESIESLTGPAGWAERFLSAAADEEHPENGAAAFIGAYWSIDSVSACAFARAFYDRLLKKDGGETKTVGEAVLEARRVIKKENDPTWLAYPVFAHPLARVEG
jgi:CHAT domain-containing protein